MDMTTILAVQGPAWAVVGFDSKVAEEGGGRAYTLGRGSAKVMKNGQYLLGAAGDVRAINILAYAFAPPSAGTLSGVKLDRFMTSKFIPALKECFETHGYAAKEQKEQSTHGSVVLAIINGQIYEIGSDYAWVRDTTGIYAFGTGGDYALGVMHAREENISSRGVTETQKLIRDAMTVAGKLDAGSGPPFHVLVQLSKDTTTKTTGDKNVRKKERSSST